MDPRALQIWLSEPGHTPLRRLPDVPMTGVEQGAASAAAPCLTIDSSRQFQTHLGFGGAFTEAAAVNWMGLQPELRQQALQAYFGDPRTGGHGYTLCRVHINSCDFALGHYTHVSAEPDPELRSFSIARDEQALLPLIRAAQQVSASPLRILASPWSPPAWMKDNGRMSHGGRLLPEYRRSWALYYVRFIEAYQRAGVPIWGITVQNEPMAAQVWDSCLYSAEDERDFVRDWLGPALHDAGLGEVKIIVWDHNRDWMVERASVIYGDPQASRYVWGMGFHWYGEDHFDHVRLVHEAWPDKALLFTEGCQEGGPHRDSWALGQRYARSMIEDLNRWTAGWIDWNLFLDLQGGPNHVGNFCSAPMLLDADAQQLLPQSSYAAMGHFSRFIEPGARRVLAASSSAQILLCAYRNPDASIVGVALNQAQTPQTVRLRVDGGLASITLPAAAIVSVRLQNNDPG